MKYVARKNICAKNNKTDLTNSLFATREMSEDQEKTVVDDFFTIIL